MIVESRKRHQMRHLDVLHRLLRDQEVGGSSPLAPTTYPEVNQLLLTCIFHSTIQNWEHLGTELRLRASSWLLFAIREAHACTRV